MKKVVNFLDRHRFLLVIFILFLISLIFLGINSYQFFHHEFLRLDCTKEINDTYCYHDNIEIYKEIGNEELFLESHEEEIKKLKEDYHLPEWNKYTSYYYETISYIDYNSNDGSEELYLFFSIYNNTYEIQSFYEKYNFYYSIFYPYKIN